MPLKLYNWSKNLNLNRAIPQLSNEIGFVTKKSKNFFCISFWSHVKSVFLRSLWTRLSKRCLSCFFGVPTRGLGQNRISFVISSILTNPFRCMSEIYFFVQIFIFMHAVHAVSAIFWKNQKWQYTISKHEIES